MRFPRFTGNPVGVVIVIVLLILLTLWFASRPNQAQGEELPVFFAGAGEEFSSSTPATQGLRVGMEQGPWQASIVTHGEAVLEIDGKRYRVDPNIAACGTWNRGVKRFSIGWGGCLWNHGDWSVGTPRAVAVDKGGLLEISDPGIQLTAAIVLRWTVREHCYLELFHASSGGSTPLNRGRNLISAGARF